MDKIQDMFELQDMFNKKAAGEDWKNGVTKDGRLINWSRTIYLEAAELIESFPYKHWKGVKGQPNWDNAHVELVDIWHFLMSWGMEIAHNNNIKQTVLLELYQEITKTEVKEKNIWNKKDYDNIDVFLEPFEYLVLFPLILKREMDLLTTEEIIEFLKEINKNFRISMENSGLSFDELHKIYIGKNALNKFRQDNGYKEGTYIKIWNNREDNEVMIEIVNSLSNINLDSVYNKLEDNYKKL